MDSHNNTSCERKKTVNLDPKCYTNSHSYSGKASDMANPSVYQHHPSTFPPPISATAYPTNNGMPSKINKLPPNPATYTPNTATAYPPNPRRYPQNPITYPPNTVMYPFPTYRNSKGPFSLVVQKLRKQVIQTHSYIASLDNLTFQNVDLQYTVALLNNLTSQKIKLNKIDVQQTTPNRRAQ